MGLMQGKIQHHTFVVLDSFALPVEGTETRVNAMDSANVFMCEYISLYGVRTILPPVTSFVDVGCWWFRSWVTGKMSLAGITVIQAMDVGCQESTCPRR